MVNLLLRMEDTDIEERDGTDNTTALMEAAGKKKNTETQIQIQKH